MMKLSKAMGPAVLKHLTNFSVIPESGIIAGQAVCSAILDLYFNKSGQVYNDIDVFYSQTNKPFLAKELAPLLYKKLTTTVHHTYAVYAQNVYGHIYVPNHHRYHVINSQSIGMLNFIECEFSEANFAVRPQSDAQSLIDSFDFNCVQVAIDLKSQELVWTKEFEEFINTRQLKIVRLHTPYHSAIRLFKKASELKNVFIDIPQQMRLVSWAAHLYESQEPVNYWTGNSSTPRLVKSLWRDARWRFGTKMRDVYLQHEASISPYFELAKDGKFFTLKPKQFSQVTEFDKRMNSFSGNAKQASIAASIFLYGKNSEKNFIEELFLRGNSHMYFLAKCLEVQGKEFLPKKQISAKELLSASNLLYKDHQAYCSFVHYPAQDLIEASKNVKKLSKEFGTWVYGELENDVVKSDFKDYAALKKDFQSKELEFQKPLKELKCPELSLPGVHIKELVTAKELMQEGEDLQHCVGGYKKRLACSSTRIFSITTSQGRSTLEVSEHGGKYITVQHRGFKNKNPHVLNEKLADWCVAYLNSCSKNKLGLSWFNPIVLTNFSMDFLRHTTIASKIKVKFRQLKLKRQNIRRKVAPVEPDFDEDIPF